VTASVVQGAATSPSSDDDEDIAPERVRAEWRTDDIVKYYNNCRILGWSYLNKNIPEERGKNEQILHDPRVV
jgi:hypothetical protein